MEQRKRLYCLIIFGPIVQKQTGDLSPVGILDWLSDAKKRKKPILKEKLSRLAEKLLNSQCEVPVKQVPCIKILFVAWKTIPGAVIEQ